MKQFLDSNGNPLEVGHEYGLVTFSDYGMTPNHPDEWIKAVWNGDSLIDNEGCTWNEWLETQGQVCPDVVY